MLNVHGEESAGCGAHRYSSCFCPHRKQDPRCTGKRFLNLSPSLGRGCSRCALVRSVVFSAISEDFAAWLAEGQEMLLCWTRSAQLDTAASAL